MAMLKEVLKQSWIALTRHPLRSFLTMLGIVWGIVAVTLLIAYGSSFRFLLVRAFDGFGKHAIIAWPGQTSEQAGGERAGKVVRFEKEDIDYIEAEAPLVKRACLETVRWLPIVYNYRLQNNPVRGVCVDYGEMRNQRPSQGRWISHEDILERRRVIVLGARIHEKLFQGKPAVGEVVQISGVRFAVIGTMDRKLNFSCYFNCDDESVFIPYSAAGDIWNTRYASVIVFEPVAPQFEVKAIAQMRAAVAKRQRFSPTDKRAIVAHGREEFRPIIDAITIGLQGLLLFVGALTLGIGGVGVMNIMLVSVDERIREIGLRRALGARRQHIRYQFLAEALVLTLIGGVVGILVSNIIAASVGTIPLLGPIFEDESGRGDIRLTISWGTVMLSSMVLVFVGVICGMVPAVRASRLDPVAALRYE
jgi:putative ABC transport system permease protein